MQGATNSATNGSVGDLTSSTGQQPIIHHQRVGGGVSDMSGLNSDWRGGSGQPQ